jgi:hypothetical protein
VVALPVAAIAVLLAGAPATDDGFQRLVGGVGLGPALDLSRCAAEFDPRAAGACSLRHDPVALGSLYCPAHAID